MLLDGRCHRAAEFLPIHGQRAACRHRTRVRATNNQRTQPAHLVLEHTERAIRQVRAKAVRTYQFGHVTGLVGGSRAHRAHLVQHHLCAVFRGLPGRFRSRQPCPNNRHSHFAICHATFTCFPCSICGMIVCKAETYVKRHFGAWPHTALCVILRSRNSPVR